jgi:hypothetical protein
MILRLHNGETETDNYRNKNNNQRRKTTKIYNFMITL